MKASMYFNYTSRSLIRGGQRTLLAIFCVAVGVMAIVALQLVGQMVSNSLTGNVRDAVGGDISVTNGNISFKQSDLTFFDKLKSQGTITNYTAIVQATGSSGSDASLRQTYNVEAVDPHNFPVVTPPTLKTPANGTLPSLLVNSQVLVTQSFVDQYDGHIGDSLDVHVLNALGGRLLHVKIAGILDDSGVFAQGRSTMLIALTDFQAVSPQAPLLYDAVDVTTSDQAHTDAAVSAIKAQFPLGNTRTVADALSSRQAIVDNIQKFLDIAGLSALLIGGVGIVNTMQVLLSRRKTEIAMLKTNGYRRTDLYLLFGLEAGLLGFIGGTVGALVATGVSFLVRNLVQQTFGLHIPFIVDPLTIGGGVLIGLATALIFGLLPIVQAANIRPLNVIRELPEGRRVGSVSLTVGLLFLLSVLFCLLAILILNHDVALGVEAVYGAFIVLGILSAVFSLFVFIVSKLPVPERFSPGYLALVVSIVVLSILLSLALPAFGGLLLVMSLLGFVIVLLPRSWKVNIKMALRNLGRQRVRTTTTLLALFVGIFTIGLIQVLGQDLRDTLNSVIATNLNFNIVTITSGNDSQTLQTQLSKVTGLNSSQHHTIASTVPATIDGQPIASLLPPEKTQSSATSLSRGDILGDLSGVEGYNIGNNQFPDPMLLTFNKGDGRNLNASDVGTDNVLLPAELADHAPLKNHLHLGSNITLVGVDGKITRTVTVVGFYQTSNFNANTQNPIIGTVDTAKALSVPGFEQTIFYMKVTPALANKAVGAIGRIVPNALVINLANIGAIIDQYLNDALLVLTTIASLSLLAGIIIIANAVALAMLERRRELGILKSVGYTSRTVLSEVLIENGIIGSMGALLAMLSVTLATSLLGQFAFHASFGVSALIVISLIVGAALLAMLTATLVAWGSVRVRPLEVLRYE